MPRTTPFPLLTVKRISELTGRPVSVIESLLAENPDILPTATADFRPVYDREAFLRLLALLDQSEAREEVQS